MPHPRKSGLSPGTVLPLSLLRCFIAASLAGKTVCAFASVSFISSSAGFMLHVSGDGAVISNWGAQSPVQGFSGFGQVHLAGRCLTGREIGADEAMRRYLEASCAAAIPFGVSNISRRFAV